MKTYSQNGMNRSLVSSNDVAEQAARARMKLRDWKLQR